MRKRLLFAAAAVVFAAALAPLQSASAVCDPRFEDATGYCSPCHLAADHSQRPDPFACPA